MAINKEELLQALSELQADGHTIGASPIPIANKELVEKLLPEVYQALQDGYKIGDSTTEAHTASDSYSKKDSYEVIEEYRKSCAKTLLELSKHHENLIHFSDVISHISKSVNELEMLLRESRFDTSLDNRY